MLSDALGRPKLMNEGLAALRTNWRSRLGVYGLVSVIGTVGLVAAAVAFWNNIVYAVLSPAWDQSLAGKIMATNFVVIAGCALIGPLISAFTEHRRRQLEDSEFESEHDDRVQAAEVWDELPWQPEFTEDELGVIAGAFELVIPEPGELLTVAGEVPAGVFVVLGPKPYVIGFESVTGAPSARTVVWESGKCAFLPGAQARRFIGPHRLAHDR